MVSSNIFTNSVLVVCAENITLDVVVKNQTAESLGDYVQRVIKEKGLTHREVEARSGDEISHSYISKIISGAAGNLTRGKLRALARGLGETEEKVFAVARGASQSDSAEFEKSEIAALFYDSKSLSAADQAELQVIWDMLKADIRRRKQKAGRST